ncbi:MAG: DUF4192 domain-containing protein [Nocardioidaceae bacterium]
MSKNPRTTKPTRSANRRTSAASVVRLSDPAELVSMIPYVLGFTPTECIVVIALHGVRRRFGPCLRMDLVDDSADCEAQSRQVLQVVDRHAFEQVVLVAFSARPALADSVICLVRRGLDERSVTVAEALRADGRRWWSYTCCEPTCCSPLGHEYDVETSRAAAEAVLHGLTRAPDRDSLRTQFTPAADGERIALASLVGISGGSVVKHVNAAIESAPEVPTEQTVVLLAAVQDLAARDAAWALMRRDNADDHFQLWRHVMRLAPDELLPPAGSLAAFGAWLGGHGVLASHALDRVAEVDASYSMARLLRTLLDLSINPDVWEAVEGSTGTAAESGAGA